MSAQNITLFPVRAVETWFACFHDDPEVVAAFGCDVIATAYTLHTSGAEVQREIEALNPGARVRLIDLDGTTHED